MGSYEIERKVELYMEENEMVHSGAGILAGVSGGADSVCMFLILLKVCRKKNVPLHVVHINHGVREEAHEDARFVERLCQKEGVPCHLELVDMVGYARKEGLSEEEAGRILRYRIFEAYLEKYNLRSIAVAHNANDRAETLLFNLFRGTGLKGMSSIRPVRDHVIRPILCLTREEIEAYLEEENVPFCHDRTNDSDDYTRNRIRHHILPFAESEIASGAVEHMNETAGQLLQIQEYLQKQTREAVSECVIGVEEGLQIDLKKFEGLDRVIQKELLRDCLAKVTPHLKDITATHIENLLKLVQVPGSCDSQLPYGLTARKEYDKLTIGILTKENIVEQLSYGMEDGDIPGLGHISFELVEDSQKVCYIRQNIRENRYTKYFDYDKITVSVLVRTRCLGDYIICDSKGHKKSIKDYMINEKIPKQKRDALWLLADGNHVMWIPGYRISEGYKISENTKRILIVRIQEENNGRTC